MNEQQKTLESFLSEIIKGIVTRPDQIEMHFTDRKDETKGEMTIVNIKVAIEDIPICIGAGGTVADAIRRLAVMVCKKIGYDKYLFVRVDAPRMPNNYFEFDN